MNLPLTLSLIKICQKYSYWMTKTKPFHRYSLVTENDPNEFLCWVGETSSISWRFLDSSNFWGTASNTSILPSSVIIIIFLHTSLILGQVFILSTEILPRINLERINTKQTSKRTAWQEPEDGAARMGSGRGGGEGGGDGEEEREKEDDTSHDDFGTAAQY